LNGLLRAPLCIINVILAILYRIYIIIKRKYPAFAVRVINCEIRVVIYTLFRVLGNENYRKEPSGKEFGASLKFHKLIFGC